MTTNYMGFEGFIWFVGVVEDRNDPLKLGRVRVRCFGIHSENKQDIPTDQLPWAIVGYPTTSASVSGKGISPSGLVEGSWVVGFFIDGTESQQPYVMSVFPGIPENAAQKSKGFFDPSGLYPLSDELTYPDTNRLGRDDEGTDHEMRKGKIDSKITEVQTATPPKLTETSQVKSDSFYENTTWDEPDPHHNDISNYPFNKVYESETGHIFEIDDTPNRERLHKYHRKGTFEEIQEDGTTITKVVKDNYRVVLGDDYAYIDGACNVTIDKDAKLLVKGDYYLEVEGDMYEKIGGSRVTKVGAAGSGNEETEILGNQTTNVNESTYHNTTEDKILTVGQDQTEIINGKLRHTTLDEASMVFPNKNLNVLVQTGQYNLFSGSTMNMKTGADFDMRAATTGNIETETGSLTITGNQNVTISATIGKVDIDGATNVEVDAGSTVDINGGTEVDVDAPTINLN